MQQQYIQEGMQQQQQHAQLQPQHVQFAQQGQQGTPPPQGGTYPHAQYAQDPHRQYGVPMQPVYGRQMSFIPETQPTPGVFTPGSEHPYNFANAYQYQLQGVQGQVQHNYPTPRMGTHMTRQQSGDFGYMV